MPVILVRLVSNSAATGLVLDIFKEFGTDSNLGLIASLLMSSTETVLYCMSVYFGAAGITKTRYTLAGRGAYCHGGGSGGQRGAGRGDVKAEAKENIAKSRVFYYNSHKKIGDPLCIGAGIVQRTVHIQRVLS